MPLAHDSAQLITGTGDIYLAYTGSWSNVGGFREGLTIRVTREWAHLRGFDQSLGTVRSALTGVNVELETTFSQATINTLRHVLNIDTALTGGNSTALLGFSFIQSTLALKFIGEDDAGDLKTWIFSQVVPSGDVEFMYTRNDHLLFPFRGTVNCTTVIGTPTANDRATIFGVTYSTSL